jgi:hypothetical protein
MTKGLRKQRGRSLVEKQMPRGHDNKKGNGKSRSGKKDTASRSGKKGTASRSSRKGHGKRTDLR